MSDADECLSRLMVPLVVALPMIPREPHGETLRLFVSLKVEDLDAAVISTQLAGLSQFTSAKSTINRYLDQILNRLETLARLSSHIAKVLFEYDIEDSNFESRFIHCPILFLLWQPALRR